MIHTIIVQNLNITGTPPIALSQWLILAENILNNLHDGTNGASIDAAEFVNDDIVFTRDDNVEIILPDAKTILKGTPGDRITNISVDDYNNVTITMFDGTNYAAGSLGHTVVRVQSIANLPSVGKYGSIYIVANSGKAYTFNEEPFGYMQIGDVETVGIIYGGDSNG